ncbi:cellulose binding domain-containing protein [Pseudobacteroides cellulosolvens]|uniref:cellulose binding domain-containing protein n=1 Tax=Pseudobacteroides cellulosolvens TaxID=35825 RepID=UPI0005663C45|nr:cellulose binding domain-containing protein [Pseudobacteroides cellulosolvens]
MDQWKLEFDWNVKIISIWNAKIESSENNHYVLSYLKHNMVIAPGCSITIGFIGKYDGCSFRLKRQKVLL